MARSGVTTLSDEKLVVMVRTEAPEDYRYVVERYQQKLFRYILSYIYDQDKAEDIVQETFIKMYINLNSFDSNRTFSSWAYKIAHNEMVNYVRKHKREIVLEDDSWIPELADDRPSLAEELDKKLSRHKLYNALALLPMKYREVLVLYYFQGHDYESIATILSIPMSTVSTRIARAKAKLKKILIKEYSNV